MAANSHWWPPVTLLVMGVLLDSRPIHFPRLLAQFFEDNYETFSKRFATNSTLKYLVSASFRSLATQEDSDSDKDTSRYSMALAQTLETIRDRVAYIKRSRDDLSDWLIKWEQHSGM
ncbi:hypothetical protein B0H19DRAFT_1261867 [Mycena capillaripes]|nr:hypothetical protein B0H19DRAFT_1261867 [Mycena capillaripes]